MTATRRYRIGLEAFALALAVAPAVRAQSTVMARADSAFQAENRALARDLYAEVLRADPAQSHAVFRMAQLEPDRARALALYQRYSALEPQDPWGPMAEGDQLSRMGRTGEALAAYDRAAAIAPAERDVAIGRARIYSRAGRSGEAARVLSDWLGIHPDDGEAWDLLGRAQRHAGRPRAAAAAFAHADSSGIRGAASRRNSAEAAAAPAVGPLMLWQHDSDGNTAQGGGAFADFMPVDGVRLGVVGHRGRIDDGVSTVDWTDAAVRASARPTPSLTLQAQAGARQFPAIPVSVPAQPGGRPPFAAGAGTNSWTMPEFDARLRWRAPSRGPSLELRAQQLALGSAPVLVANEVSRTEGRAILELPIWRLRLRGGARAGVMQAVGEANNARVGADGALVFPFGGTAELSAQYHEIGFQRASTAGYFAPRTAQTMEGGLYFELGDEGPLSVAADLGGGMQRIARQGEDVGPWKPAWRGWSYVALSLGASRALWSEIEAYDAPFAPAGAVTSASWRYLSVSLGVSWALH